MTGQRAAVLGTVVVVVAAIAVAAVWRISSSPEAAEAEDERAEAEQERPEDLHLDSASRGPEGTRDIDSVPVEIPAALVPDDGRDRSATVSRSGEFWNASLTFDVDADLDTLAREMDGRVGPDGFVLRQRIIETHRTVAIYDSDDGAVLTVNYRVEDGAVRVRAVLVGS